MAKKKAGEPNKSKVIRDYKNEHPGEGPKSIAAALSATGLKVTPGFVSTVLSNDKRKSGKSRGPGRRGRKPASETAGDSIEQLIQAKRLVDKLGGIDKARSAIDALAKLLG